jgi:acyl transferase domain-containing protein
MLIGSVKTNIGHGEAVSGISSVIKATLALEHKVIPPTIGIQELNPALKLAERNIQVATKLTPWPKNTVQRISINSFGYGGANAHAIVESTSMHLTQDHNRMCDGARSIGHSFLLPFSANNLQSLEKNMEAIAYSKFASSNLRGLAYTLGARRSGLSARGYLLGNENESEVHFSATKSKAQAWAHHQSLPPFAFIFTGQGAQWPGMGRELLDQFPIYRQTMQELDSYLARLPHAPSWTLEGKTPLHCA